MTEKLIVIIGAGNVATNLAFAFKNKTEAKIHIHGKTEKSTKNLAEKLNAPYSFKVKEIPQNADLYILSVNDDAVFDLAENTLLKEKAENNLIVHTAGSIDIEVLKNISGNYGVFYPLQTFSKNKILDFTNIPICIEASSGFNYNKLRKFALEISEDVRNFNSEQRKYIHLAAVFANNFTNRILTFAEEILDEKDIDFNILYPLIEETFSKIQKEKPSKIQTGPAARNDKTILKLHLEMLKNKPDLYKIYSFVSENILKSEK